MSPPSTSSAHGGMPALGNPDPRNLLWRLIGRGFADFRPLQYKVGGLFHPQGLLARDVIRAGRSPAGVSHRYPSRWKIRTATAVARAVSASLMAHMPPFVALLPACRHRCLRGDENCLGIARLLLHILQRLLGPRVGAAGRPACGPGSVLHSGLVSPCHPSSANSTPALAANLPSWCRSANLGARPPA